MLEQHSRPASILKPDRLRTNEGPVISRCYPLQEFFKALQIFLFTGTMVYLTAGIWRCSADN